jgi:UDP-N-acetyl-D-mannosaminuronic acid dehydrogenase
MIDEGALFDRLEHKTASVGVIGLGYVGLPVACLFADAGFAVVGLDVKAERVAQINSGDCPIKGNEPGLQVLLARVVQAGNLRATVDPTVLAAADVITINVETPVDDQHVPRYDALRAACRALGPVLKLGALVIVESTIAPGTMRDVVQPILEQTSGRQVNVGFCLAVCPERVMPGRLLRNLREMSRVIGGSSPAAERLARRFYQHIVQADLDTTDCLTAELVKTTENAYRDVQIAFANEVALICEAVGADVWRVRDLVNKSPFRNMHLPGTGVGGHCIPKDPWLLAYGAGERAPLRLIPAARAVNESMPAHLADMALDALREAGIAASQARVVVLGYAYLENSDDTRHTPAEPLVQRLRAAGITPRIHDPFVPAYQGDLSALIQSADCLVLTVSHDAYLALDLDEVRRAMRTPILVDGRNAFGVVEGFISRSVGRG